ncbi:MAG TPA: response regulator [Polyangiales bacterium]
MADGKLDGWYALVADDDDDFRTLAARALRRAGFQVCEARDGEELVERFAALRVLTDQHVVVVSDIAMPGRDGVTATAVLRNASPELPIVLVTGESSPLIWRAAQSAGASMVLAKPVDCTTLVERVRTLCH